MVRIALLHFFILSLDQKGMGSTKLLPVTGYYLFLFQKVPKQRRIDILKISGCHF